MTTEYTTISSELQSAIRKHQQLLASTRPAYAPSDRLPSVVSSVAAEEALEIGDIGEAAEHVDLALHVCLSSLSDTGVFEPSQVTPEAQAVALGTSEVVARIHSLNWFQPLVDYSAGLVDRYVEDYVAAGASA